MIEILLRFSLFGLSLAGYAYLFVRVCHFPKHISWIAACCLPILVLSFVAYGPKGWLIWGGMGFIWSWFTIMRLAFLAGALSGTLGLARAHPAVVLRLFCFVRFNLASQSFDPL